MSTKNISIKFRPVRLGFLVRNGSLDDVVRAAGLNSLLCGGIYNPLIPIGKDTATAERWMTNFNVDIIEAVSHSDEIDAFAAKHPLLRSPFFISTNFLYEDWYTKKNKLMYLSVLNVINSLRHEETEYQSIGWTPDHVLPIWDDDHPMKKLFSVCFGFYPNDLNLKDDFTTFYFAGLKAKEILILPDDGPPPILAKTGYPLSLTRERLEGHGGTMRDRGLGVYVGDENDFNDLVLFWNIRAAGMNVEFLPLGSREKFMPFIDAFLKRLCQIPLSPSERVDFLSAYCRHDRVEEVKAIISGINCAKRLIALPCDDNALWNYNINIKNPYFSQYQRLANIAKGDHYELSFDFPEVPLLAGMAQEIERQSLIVSVDSLKEDFAYPGHTLKPPFIRALSGFYGVGMLQNAFRVKAERNGIRVVIEPKETSLSLWPIQQELLFERVFELAGIKAKVSQPGIITNQILTKLKGIEGARVFKITGVRKLLETLKKDSSVTRGHATNVIRENDFSRFEDLYIEPRQEEKLTASQTFSFLLKKEFLRAGLDLICNHCRLESWLSLEQIADYWTCAYCGGRNQTSLHLKDRGDWKFRKSGLFAKDNNQEGAIPVILTLLQLYRRLNHFGLLHAASHNLNFDAKSCEIDFAVLQYSISDRVELGIGECKSEGGVISVEDVENLKAVRDRFAPSGIYVFPIFAKTAESFQPEEIALFQQLSEEDVDFILFSNRELETYEPYESYEREDLVDQFPSTLQGMAWNSRKIYLP
jgi:hypothetical protein